MPLLIMLLLMSAGRAEQVDFVESGYVYKLGYRNLVFRGHMHPKLGIKFENAGILPILAPGEEIVALNDYGAWMVNAAGQIFQTPFHVSNLAQAKPWQSRGTLDLSAGDRVIGADGIKTYKVDLRGQLWLRYEDRPWRPQGTVTHGRALHTDGVFLFIYSEKGIVYRTHHMRTVGAEPDYMEAMPWIELRHPPTCASNL